MKYRFLPVLILGLIFLLSIIVGCAKQEKDRTIVDDHVSSAVWSKDSRYLFYDKTKDDLIYRYDVVSKKKISQNIHGAYVSDVSPDGKWIVFHGYMGLYIANFETQVERKVYSTRQSIEHISWATQHQILFSQDRSEEGPEDIYLLDLGNRQAKPILKKASILHHSSDGEGFIYTNKAGIHYYDLPNMTSKPLLHPALNNEDISINFIYLSDRRFVYVASPMSDAKSYVELLDIASMKTKTIQLPNTAHFMEISPDAARYWYTGPDHQDTEPVKLYLVDIPQETIRQIKGK